MRWSCQVAGVGKKPMFYDSSLENANKKEKKRKEKKVRTFLKLLFPQLRP